MNNVTNKENKFVYYFFLEVKYKGVFCINNEDIFHFTPKLSFKAGVCS